MKIAIHGLGYVGAVSAACFAKLGHEVLGVDVNAEKVAQINRGVTPIAEAGLGDLIAEGVAGGQLRATSSTVEAVEWADISLVCVGTPSRPNGGLDTSYVESVVASIAEALRQSPRSADRRHTVVVRSTLLPGTTNCQLAPLLAGSNGPIAGLAYNPEFLREGTAVRDFETPPFTVIGSADAASAAAVQAIYAGVDAPVHRVTISEAEMIKYGANAFHALKITFANEIGNFSKSAGVDGHRVMELLCQDTKLNVSPAYLKPGYAYGGSCLPKDLRAILHAARQADLELPLLESLPRSNSLQVQRGIDMVLDQGKRKVGILGLSFKAGTDDLRESPIVALVEALIGKGCQLKIYDRNVSWAKVVGANRRFIESTIPHISELLVENAREVIDHADVLVIGNNDPEFSCLLADAQNKAVIDLVRVSPSAKHLAREQGTEYHGICW